MVSPGDPFAKYRLAEKIGVGATGTVWTAHNLVTGQVVAVKRMAFRSQQKKEMLLTEIKVMQQYRHQVGICFRFWHLRLTEFYFYELYILKNVFGNFAPFFI